MKRGSVKEDPVVKFIENIPYVEKWWKFNLCARVMLLFMLHPLMGWSL